MKITGFFTKFAQNIRDRVSEVVEYTTPESEPVIFRIGAYGHQRADLPARDYVRRDVLINFQTKERIYLEEEPVQIQKRSCETPRARAMKMEEIGQFCNGISHLPPQEYAKRAVEYCESSATRKPLSVDELAQFCAGMPVGVGEEEYLARLDEIKEII